MQPPPAYSPAPSPYAPQSMGAPPAPLAKKGGGVGLIAGIVVAAIVIGAGGYFAYTKFMGPKEPGAEVAQTQQPPAGQDQSAATPGQTPAGPVDTASSQPSVEPVQPSAQAQSPSTAYQPPPQGGGQRPVNATPSGAYQPAREQTPVQQSPSYAPPPQQSQPAAPAYTPPPSRPAPQPVEERQPILRPERSYPPAPVTPATPQTATAPPASTAARYTGPSSGMLMWSGKLDRNAVVTIDGSSASTGTLRGTLPGVPVTLETDLTNIGFAEMPSPSNGWKKVSLRSKKSQNIVINIRWRVID